MKRASSSAVALTLVTAVVVYALWNTPVVYPLKILVVFLHEISHGLAAVATGGSIVRIELSPNEGGACVTRGGSRFLTASAGYLGSTLWGALFLVAAARTRLDRALVGFVGVFIALVTLLFVRSAFGFVYGLAAGLVLAAVAFKLSAGVSDALLRIIGCVSCLYAPWDIASDVIFRDARGSDAHTIAAITHLPAVFWGVVWIVISVAVGAGALFLSARGPRTGRGGRRA